MTETHAPLKLVVLISGRGSNLKAILEAIDAGELPAVVSAVISNRVDAPGLACASERAIDTLVLDAADYPDREAYDHALQGMIDLFKPGLVVLAGFMRILSPAFVHHYSGRLINIHPSLLPELRGLDTHRRALEAGHTEHGASVHFVTEELDGGPVIAQVRLPVLPDDNADTLEQRVLEQEHRLYVTVIQWIAEGRVSLEDDGLHFDGEVLDAPKQLEAA
ncbi:phosphoribosylglycinamide formyltransferase-1 [Thiogranum longum]|uniref:Phosphoribosylglycinamide formyltransferase n=1 Tax=Thiogranum longum TaxID=1537524 RepID=A0A4R1HKU9_9GAMM|nr:phosphoribosylglycinamide formyltransferase [Thiogranum longum]TCK17832.1 phosphoribosylglycinamide formyltransferase-1 [Thiogranum longum]